ncbi:hypothetical protein NOC27_529 [Nitrosococcus oceani AFC27]|nr:hypothetical protein NOC27_529 [Nitrosococcus oceani AFC27]
MRQPANIRWQSRGYLPFIDLEARQHKLCFNCVALFSVMTKEELCPHYKQA